jgi:hypothetical protein
MWAQSECGQDQDQQMHVQMKLVEHRATLWECSVQLLTICESQEDSCNIPDNPITESISCNVPTMFPQPKQMFKRLKKMCSGNILVTSGVFSTLKVTLHNHLHN